MVAIKYSESLGCEKEDGRCGEITCPLHKLFVRKKAFFATHDIPLARCLYLLDVIHDVEKRDIVLRNWVEDTFVKRLDTPALPPKSHK